MMTARRVPIIEYADLGDITAVERLIKKGCNVDEKDYCGNCAVISCVERNDTDILQKLIDANANLEVMDSLGTTAVNLAKELKHYSVAQLIEDTVAKRKLSIPNIDKPEPLQNVLPKFLYSSNNHSDLRKSKHVEMKDDPKKISPRAESVSSRKAVINSKKNNSRI